MAYALRTSVSSLVQLVKEKSDLFLGTGAGIVLGEIISSAIASAARLGGRTYIAAKIGAKIPIALGLAYLGMKMKLNPDIYVGLAAGSIGSIVADVFKMIAGVGPDVYGDMLGMTIASWFETAMYSSMAAHRASTSGTTESAEVSNYGEGVVVYPPEEEEKKIEEETGTETETEYVITA